MFILRFQLDRRLRPARRFIPLGTLAPPELAALPHGLADDIAGHLVPFVLPGHEQHTRGLRLIAAILRIEERTFRPCLPLHVDIVHNVPVVIAVKRMLNFSRYGNVSIDGNNIVTAFNEKQFCRDGFINGGVYDLSRTALEDCPTVFSIENNYFPALVKEKKICAFQDDGCFIDIGIPEDYELAQKLLARV